MVGRGGGGGGVGVLGDGVRGNVGLPVGGPDLAWVGGWVIRASRIFLFTC